VVAEGVAAQLGRGHEAPVDLHRLGQRCRQDGEDVALGVAQFLPQPVVGALQGFLRRGELAMGAREFPVGRLELLDQPGFALAEQGHVVGLLLDPLRLLVFGRHIEQNDPDRRVVGEEVHVGHAAAGHFHGTQEEGVLHQRQQALEEGDLVAGGVAGLDACQAVVRQLAAGMHQLQRVVDGQVRKHALPMDQHHQRVGNPVRQVQHG
jgi:hypothetical protein